jgi:hypothetical protein
MVDLNLTLLMSITATRTPSSIHELNILVYVLCK